MELLLSPLSSMAKRQSGAASWLQQQKEMEGTGSLSSQSLGNRKRLAQKKCWKNGTSAVVTLRIPVASSLGNRSGLRGLGFLFNGFLLIHRSETSGKCQYLLVSTDSNVSLVSNSSASS